MPLTAAQDLRETPFAQRSVENSQIAFSLKRPARGSWTMGRLRGQRGLQALRLRVTAPAQSAGAGSVLFIHHEGRDLG